MGKFTFDKKESIVLDIEGVICSIPSTTAYFGKVRGCLAEVKEYPAPQDEDVNALDDFTEFLLDILERLLGAGTVDAILDKRDMDYYDCAMVLKYVAEEVNTHQAEKAERLAELGTLQMMDESSDTTEEEKPQAAPRPRNRAERRVAMRHHKSE